MSSAHIPPEDLSGPAAGGAASDPPLPALQSGRFSGRKEFQQLVRDSFATAARDGWREIIVCDAGFEDWPLGERAVSESLRAWSKTGRRFIMLARNYDELQRRHPRFVSWRRTWSHIIDCWSCSSADPLELPSALYSPAWVMRRLDLERSTGICGSEPERRVAMRELIEEWLRKSGPGFPASTLGL